jgi:hypothetical protein
MQTVNDPHTDRAETLAQFAIDYWKLLRSFERSLSELSEERARRLSAQQRYSAARLGQHCEALEMRLLDFEGLSFGPELPAIPINADEFSAGAALIVDCAVEPAVLIGGKVFSPARVMLIEGVSDVSRN